MIPADGCAYAAIRAAVTAGFALPVAIPLASWLRRTPRHAGRLAWLLLLLPFLTPSLLVGYAWANHTPAILLGPLGTEALYVTLLVLKLTPCAVAAVALAPRRMPAESDHCHRLSCAARRPGWRSIVGVGRFILAGRAGPAVAAAALVFFAAFGEFEMATLLGLESWTVTVFEAQAGGLRLGVSFALVALPLVLQGAALGVVFTMLLGKRRLPDDGAARGAPGSRSPAARWGYLVVAAAAVTVGPALLVGRGLVAGLATITADFGLWKEVAASLVMGGSAAVLAYLSAGQLLERRSTPVTILVLLSLPGLLGPLVLGLGMIALFQLPGLRALYDTPLPLLVTQTLLLLPPALVLRLAFRIFKPAEGVHLAAMLRAAAPTALRASGDRIRWHHETRGRALAFFLLWCWGYFELTAASLLAPSTMTPVFVRLYNFMHYGQSAVLSAMVAVVIAIPVLGLVAGASSWRLIARGVRRV